MEKPALVMIHGLLGSLSYFEPQRRIRRAGCLQQPVTPRKNLSIAQQGGKVAGIETRCEPVDEAASSRRRPIQDSQVLPAEHDDPGPGAEVARTLPRPVLAPLNRPPDGPRTFCMDELTAQRRGAGPPRRQLRQARCPKRTAREEDSEPFEGVRLALRVASFQDVQPAGRSIGKAAIIAKITQYQATNFHP